MQKNELSKATLAIAPSYAQQQTSNSRFENSIDTVGNKTPQRSVEYEDSLDIKSELEDDIKENLTKQMKQ